MTSPAMLRPLATSLVALAIGVISIVWGALAEQGENLHSLVPHWLLAIALGATVTAYILVTVGASLTPLPDVAGRTDHGRWRRHLSAPRVAVFGSLMLVIGEVGQLFPDRVALAVALVVALLTVVLAGCAVAAVVLEQAGKGRARSATKRALATYSPEAIVYAGRSDGGRYQVERWLPVLTFAHARILLVTRTRDAFRALRPLRGSRVQVVLLPRQSDLDLIDLSTVGIVYYPGSASLNANMISFRGPKHVYLGHGDSDKEISVHPTHRMYDHVFVAGQEAVDRYQHHSMPLLEGSLRIVGRPWVGPHHHVASEVGAEIGTVPLSEEEPQERLRTVLYAPTWGGYNQASSLGSLPWGLELVHALVGAGARVVFRPHPLSMQKHDEKKFIDAIDLALQQAGPVHLTSADTAKLSSEATMDLADAMVTDVSSMLVEFLPHGGPIAVVKHPNVDVTVYPSTRFATVIGNVEDVRTWLDSDDKAEERAAAAERYVATTDPRVFVETVKDITASTAG